MLKLLRMVSLGNTTVMHRSTSVNLNASWPGFRLESGSRLNKNGGTAALRERSRLHLSLPTDATLRRYTTEIVVQILSSDSYDHSYSRYVKIV